MTIEISWKADYNNNAEYEAGLKLCEKVMDILDSNGYGLAYEDEGDYKTYMAIMVHIEKDPEEEEAMEGLWESDQLWDIEKLMEGLDVEVKAA